MNRMVVLTALIIGFLIILVDGLLTYKFLSKLNELLELRIKSVHNIITLEDYISKIKDAESSQRGYLITGDDAYLTPYYAALEYFKTDSIQSFVKENQADPETGPKFIELQELLQNKLIEMQKTLDNRKNGSLDSSKKELLGNFGLKLMDQINERGNSILNHYLTQLEQRGKDIASTFRRLFYIIFIANLIAFASIAACLFLLHLGINERVKTENELNNLHHLQDVILDTTKESIITLDPKGTITSFNTGAANIFGFSPGNVIGSNLESLLENLDNQRLLTTLSKRHETSFKSILDYLIFANKQDLTDENRWTAFTKSGEKLHLLFSLSSLAFQDPQIKGYLLEGVDVSEKQNWEEQLKIAQLRAESANAIKKQFIAHISHDLKTPVTAILGFAEILRINKSGHLENKEISYLNRIEENGKNLLSLIDKILDMEELEEGKLILNKTYIDLKILVEAVIKQLENQFIERNLKLILEIPQPMKLHYTDQQKLSQILTHLIGNALKFTKEGFIKIAIIRNAIQEPIKIEISDTGKGIPEAEFNKIFDPFYQVHDNSPKKNLGSGLGLSITKSLCDLLNYQIYVTSEVGKGSTFSIHLG